MNSIRARVTAAFTLATALLLLLSGGALVSQARQAAVRRAREQLDAGLLRAHTELGERESAHRSLLEMAREEQGDLATGDLSLLVLDAHNRPLWRSRQHAPDWPLRDGEAANWRVETLRHNTQTLVLALPWAATEHELREDAWRLALLGLMLVAASGAGAWLLVGRTLSPIEQLAEQAQNASTERLRVQLAAPSGDAEIRRLVGTLNGMLERLTRDAAGRAHFYASASHELRTPLQALIGDLDVTLSRPREREKYLDALQRAQDEALRLMALVQSLLQLNHLEMSPPPPCLKLFVADEIERALQPLAPMIVARGLTLQTQLAEAEVSVPPAHLEMICRNLLENAVRHATPGGWVRVTVEALDEGARLDIWNDCDIAPGADLDSWFAPFSRADVSCQVQGGNGLGLAICRAVAQGNGWTLRLEAVEGGVRAMVVWSGGGRLRSSRSETSTSFLP